MRTATYLIVLFSMAAISTSLMAAEPQGWDGTYAYTYDESARQEEYVLTLGPQAGPSACVLRTRNAVQANDIVCTVIERKTEADIIFKSFGNGLITDGNGVQTYRAGDVLFTLIRAKGKLSTRWNKFAPTGEVSKGRFFKKEKQ